MDGRNDAEQRVHEEQQDRIDMWRTLEASANLADAVARYMHQDVGINQLASSLAAYRTARGSAL